MKFALAAFASTTLLTTTLANGIVQNNCPFPVYVRVNNAPQVSTIPSKGTFQQGPGTGTAIKLGTQPALSAPLTFEYSVSGNTVYYSLSNNAGNPFATYRNTMTPAIGTCPAVNCAPNDAACYSNGASPKVKACQNTNITARLCA